MNAPPQQLNKVTPGALLPPPVAAAGAVDTQRGPACLLTSLQAGPCEWLLPLRKTVPVLAADGSQARGEDGLPLWVEISGPWSDPVLRKLAADLRERTAGPGQPGVEFSWKTMRATFGQRARDAGARIDKVSRAMRHASTKTTEEFYARVSAGAALEAVNKALSRPVRRE